VVPGAGLDECGRSCFHRDSISFRPAWGKSLYRQHSPGPHTREYVLD